ncbi:MAG: 30S ribosomal protein S6 [Alphaproteobacteria bacterium]|nr:30S ribosomal protein S6 [Alphaproteobacteria bacterium]
MAYYETVVLVRQDATPAQVKSLTEKLVEFIKSDKSAGQISRNEYWGLKQLAYPIRKNHHAHYLCFNYEAASAHKDEMERQLRLNEDVLRYLTIKTEDLPTEESIQMKPVEEEPEDGRRPNRGDRPNRGERPERS